MFPRSQVEDQALTLPAMSEAVLTRLRASLAARTRRDAARSAATREAAVALVLRAADTLELLLIERVDRPGDPWAGHMAFPGGRRQPEDPDLLHTALRETHEEVGLSLDPGRDLLGPLDEVVPGTTRLPPIVIAPYVLRAAPDAEPVPDPREVETALWIPVTDLMHDGAIGEILIELDQGESQRFPTLNYQDYQIWGLTHRILEQLLEELGSVR